MHRRSSHDHPSCGLHPGKHRDGLETAPVQVCLRNTSILIWSNGCDLFFALSIHYFNYFSVLLWQVRLSWQHFRKPQAPPVTNMSFQHLCED